MRKLAHILRFVAFTGQLALSTSVSGEVFKCVDETTEKVTFTDKACPDKGVGNYVPLEPANVDSGYASGREAGRNRTESAQQAVDRGNAAFFEKHGCDPTCIIKGKFYGPKKNSRNQREAAGRAAQDLLIERPVSQPPSHPMPMPQSPPIIVNPDPAGAWDNNGNRYNKAAGDTYFRADGKACQLLNTGMQCN